jgi:hypothetical protein
VTPIEEHTLYLTDRAAWAAYVAPCWVEILKQSDEAERRRTWAMACPELRDAIRALAIKEAA